MKRRELWQRLESPTESPHMGIVHGYLVGGHKGKPTRAQLLWALRVVRCWWRDDLHLPPEPVSKGMPREEEK